MAAVALTTWTLAALFGAYMLGVTFRVANPDSPARHSHLPQVALLAHPTVNLVAGLLILIHLVTDSTGAAWAALGALVVGGSLGGLMASRWFKDRRDAGPEERLRLVEQHFPTAVVVTHGLLATVTVLMLLLSALGV